MDGILSFLTIEFHGVPIISILVAALSLVLIVPFWAAAIRMTAYRRMRGWRIGITAMMGPLLWYLLEPVWLWFKADLSTTANFGLLSLLVAMCIYFWWTHGIRMTSIERMRKEDEGGHAV